MVYGIMPDLGLVELESTPLQQHIAQLSDVEETTNLGVVPTNTS